MKINEYFCDISAKSVITFLVNSLTFLLSLTFVIKMFSNIQ